MERKEFLKQLWKKVFMPVLVFAIAFFSVRFLIHSTEKGSAEQIILIVVVFLILLFSFASILGVFFQKITARIYNRLSDKTKYYLRISGKILEFATLLMFGAFCYWYWQKDKVLTILCIAWVLFGSINRIMKEEKQARVH